MTWEKLMQTIEIEGTEEELELMKPRVFTIAQLSDLLGVTPIRIYQLQKRKKRPLPLIKNEKASGRKVWAIKEIPLLEWIDGEEGKIDARKKVDYGKVHEHFEEVFDKRDEIIEKFMDDIELE